MTAVESTGCPPRVALHDPGIRGPPCGTLRHARGARVNCFVIMPFADDFDDVYAAIRSGVEAVLEPRGGRCFRLDESRPAGRITDRLIRELRSAALCIADVSGARPNVMWETGYAMALNVPTLLLTQDAGAVPFDIRDMQCLAYDRKHLGQTLGTPLRQAVIDTLAHANLTVTVSTPAQSAAHSEVVRALFDEMNELKRMVGDAVRLWTPRPEPLDLPALSALQGAWFNRESRSYCYARLVDGD